ncbi:MAG TPA: hypothetical protein VGM50_17830 [Gemmatimonadaceae bacterium]
MWADTFLRAEQQYLLRLFLWAGLSIVAATIVAVMLAARRVRSPLLTHFAIQMGVWGAAIAIFAAVWWTKLHIRDLGGATIVERFAWASVGLDVGLVALGATLAATGHRLARSMAVMGAGTAIVVQGLSLFLLDLHFAALISR